MTRYLIFARTNDSRLEAMKPTLICTEAIKRVVFEEPKSHCTEPQRTRVNCPPSLRFRGVSRLEPR